MGKTPCRNHPTIELLLFLTIVIKCSTASGGKQGEGKQKGREKDTQMVGNVKKRGTKLEKKEISGKYFGCKFSQWEELIWAGGKQGWGWDCCPRKWLLSHLKVTTMRGSPFLDLRSVTAKKTCAATVTQHKHTYTQTHTSTHRQIGNVEVGHLQEEISVTRQGYEHGTVDCSCPWSARSWHN